MNISFDLIKHFKNQGDLRTLATILFLKSKYKNGCFLGSTTVRDIAHHLNVSKSTAAKYLKRCDKYIRIHSGNTCILSFKAICRQLGFKRTKGLVITKFGSVKEIEQEIYYLILKNKYNQFEYIKNKSSDLSNPSGSNALKRHKSAKRFMRNKKIIGEKVKYSVSYKRMGLHFGVSVGKAYNITKKFIKQGKMVKHSRFVINGKLYHNGLMQYWGFDDKSRFVSKASNKVTVLRNEYVFMS